MSTSIEQPDDQAQKPERPFRNAVLRGLGVVFPPLLTVVIFLWVGSTINMYVMQPLFDGAKIAAAWSVSDIKHDVTETDPETGNPMADGVQYQKLPNDTYVPLDVYQFVSTNRGKRSMPETGIAVYERYVELVYLRPYLVIPFFLAIFIIVLYLLGKFMAAGIGRFAVKTFERGVHQLPLIRNVYSSVKQVSDFLFSPREIEYTRVVAIEYPRKGIWSLGMVTGESMRDIRSVANEPVLSVLIPTSPMPVTGYTVTVLKSETVDLNITIDQAFQFVVSCGVVIPPKQLSEIAQKANNAITDQTDNGSEADG